MPPPAPESAQPHLASVRTLPGIGPARTQALAEAGVHTLWDVLHEVPALAPPPPPWCEHGHLPGGMPVRLRAQVRGIRPLYRGRRGRALEVALQRADGLVLQARFFHAAYLAKQLKLEGWYCWEGRLDETGRILLHPRFTAHARGDGPLIEDATVRVRYRAIPGFSATLWNALVEAAASAGLGGISDPLGEEEPAAYQMLLMQAHRPASVEALQDSRRALARRELRALAWRLQELLPEASEVPGRSWRWSDQDDQRHRALLPYPLSSGQEQALAEIRQDLRQPSAMCRLLQGEVGSGKTALALLACLAVVSDGAQAFVLAPTSILAEQHHRFISGCLQGTPWRCALLTAALTPPQRQLLLTQLRSGEVMILVGTHALLHEEVVVPALGLVVIDEQHRFGVAQRLAVVANMHQRQGWRPDVLLLSATPIPRTLALTLYGGMAMTQLRGLPPGRQEVTTRVLELSAGAGAIIPLVQEAIAGGGRVFVVCARKFAGAAGTSASEVHGLLGAALRGHAQVALVHGDLDEEEKRAAMAAFASGRARVLVSTSLIEVGIDVPEATHLVVVDADRFGLAQLHQLRGRLGRGGSMGWCILCLPHLEASAPALERLQLLCTLRDGLAISEADLAERGPGDLLGTLQHGAFELRIADLGQDLELLQLAHEEVRHARGRGERPSAALRLFLREDGLAVMTP